MEKNLETEEEVKTFATRRKAENGVKQTKRIDVDKFSMYNTQNCSTAKGKFSRAKSLNRYSPNPLIYFYATVPIQVTTVYVQDIVPNKPQKYLEKQLSLLKLLASCINYSTLAVEETSFLNLSKLAIS